MLTPAQLRQRSNAGKKGGRACLEKYGREFYSRIGSHHSPKGTRAERAAKAWEEWEQRPRARNMKGGMQSAPRSRLSTAPESPGAKPDNTSEVRMPGSKTGYHIYVGRRIPNKTLVGVKREDPPYTKKLPDRLDLQNHSPSGFEWGYEGSGPAQLALAILAHATDDDVYALGAYQDFKREVISKLPFEEWDMSERLVLDWVQAHPLSGESRQYVEDVLALKVDF